MKNILKSHTLSTGLAMFAMFFGAGNVVFPLTLGQITKDMTIYAVIGLFLSAIIVPFLGLIAMILFNGKYQDFFGRLGKIPGFLITLFIMCLIGPFGAIPRCIALSYSTSTLFAPNLSLIYFSLISCVLIFLFTVKQNALIDVLGTVLTPFLLFSLGIIVIISLIKPADAIVSDKEPLQAFWLGLKEGYHTMDLLAAFFFSTIIIDCLKANLHPTDKEDHKKIKITSLKASAIGAFLLGAIYIGFSFAAANNSLELEGVAQDLLVATLSVNTLGSYAGIIACFAVALACLTTAIALASAFANFLHREISHKKISYPASLVLTLIVTFFVSTLNFSGIARVLTPILSICYPALIVLSIVNLLNKLYGFKPVKTPVFLVLAYSLYSYLHEMNLL